MYINIGVKRLCPRNRGTETTPLFEQKIFMFNHGGEQHRMVPWVMRFLSVGSIDLDLAKTLYYIFVPLVNCAYIIRFFSSVDKTRFLKFAANHLQKKGPPI